MVRIQRLGMFLEAHFGEVEYHMPDEDMDEQEGAAPDGEPSFLIQLDDAEARINLLSMVHSPLCSHGLLPLLMIICTDGR
jgi:cleavage and polyadenylation specificity factor subunit 3